MSELEAALAAARAREQRLREALEAWPMDGSVHEEGCAAVTPGVACDCFTSIASAALMAAPAADEESRSLDGLPFSVAAELHDAEQAFLAAAVAVWLAIDEREAMPGGYSARPLTQDTELRKVERAAWERYRAASMRARAALAAEPAATLAEPGKQSPDRFGAAPGEHDAAPGSASAAADEPGEQ